MSDETGSSGGDPSSPTGDDGLGGLDGLDELPEFDGLDGLDESTATPTEVGREGGPGRRFGGALALILGVIGVLLALVLAFAALRMLFGASGRVDDAMAPVTSAFDRLEERIDEADDLIDRRGIDEEQVGELRARVDGLVDLADAADRGLEAIEDHPVYGLLPADLSGLGDSLDRFSASAAAIDESLGSSPTVRSAAAAAMADEINGMQDRVTDARTTIDDAASSLRTWIRIGGLVGFLIALWMLWSQVVLARRGWRGVRNQPV